MREHLFNLLGVAFSVFLLLLSLYQIEITVYEYATNQLFVCPFDLCHVRLDVARDFWYGMDLLSWVVLFVALWFWQ